MKILITGIDGYIGSCLSPVLLDCGHAVFGLDTGYYREGWLYNSDQGKFPTTLNKDIREITESDLKGFDAVVHLAELSNDPLGQTNPENTFEINHQGSLRLAKLSKKAGVRRFVYTSSCSVYGVGNGDNYVDEQTKPNPQTAYARCKLLVERDVKKLADSHFSPTFLRNATAYGPSPRMRFDIVLNNLAGLAYTTKEIKMISDGTPWRPLVHVLDICEVIVKVLESDTKLVYNQIFNVGETAENYQVRDVARIIGNIIPECKVTFGEPDGDNRSYRVSFGKLKNDLGFRCKRTVEDGARELYELFQKIDLTYEQFTSRPFTRLKQIEYLKATKQLDEKLYWINK